MSNKIVVCPKCGIKVEATLIRNWKLPCRPPKRGMRTVLTIGMFKCKNGHSFRKVIKREKVAS